MKRKPINPAQLDRPDLDDWRVKRTRQQRQARAWSRLLDNGALGAPQPLGGNMAATKKQQQEMIDRFFSEGKKISDGEFFKFDRPGQYIVGRVLSAQGPSEHVRTGLIRLADVDGQVWAVGLGGNLAGMLKDRVDLRGKVIGVMFEKQDEPDGKLDDAGQPFSGMKWYAVVVYGDTFPSWAEAADNLPF